MPIYEFQCVACRHLFEEFFTRAVDKPVAKCPECGGKGKKIISNVGIVFKGGGFYVTDSRTGPSSSGSRSTEKVATAAKESGTDVANSTPASGESDTASKPASKPAKESGTASSTGGDGD